MPQRAMTAILLNQLTSQMKSNRIRLKSAHIVKHPVYLPSEGYIWSTSIRFADSRVVVTEHRIEKKVLSELWHAKICTFPGKRESSRSIWRQLDCILRLFKHLSSPSA